ncbi:MAG: porin [Phascolarctobacterium sp.]
MKKSLVLAMAMALGVTASAYAANPFSDVPAGHWAYDSISKLAAAGVIEGYGDATFGGDKLMTRYEMAQIVAKAMAKGANVDKLAAEFADELDNLGVRVAALEKKADNVKISGQIRYEYADRNGDLQKTKGHIAKNRLRTRLFVNGQVNDDWSYTARIQNDQNLANNTGDEETKLNMAYLTGKLGGAKVVAGKAPMFLADGNLFDDYAEFIGLTYGKDLKLNAYWGQPVDYGYDEFWGVNVAGKIGKLGLQAGYDQFKDGVGAAPVVAGEDNGVFNVGAKYAFDKNVSLDAIYLHSDVDSDALVAGADTDGYVIGLAYKGAKASNVGSWGAWAKYYDQGAGTFVAHTMKAGDWSEFEKEGFKGYGIGATYTLAKNIVYMLDYYDLEGKETSTDTQVLWSRLQVTF